MDASEVIGMVLRALKTVLGIYAFWIIVLFIWALSKGAFI